MSACLAPRPEQAGCRWVPGLLLTLVAGAISPLDHVLAGMVRRGLGCEAIRLYLQLSCDAFDDALARLGLARPHERPLRKSHPRGWGLIEVWKLVALWLAGVHPATIGMLLGRSKGSVRSKGYRLGLPRRDRKLLTRDLAIAARVAVAAASPAAPGRLTSTVSAPRSATRATASPATRSAAGCSDGAQAVGLTAGGMNIVSPHGSGETPADSRISKVETTGRSVLQRPKAPLELPVQGSAARGPDKNELTARGSGDIPLPEAPASNRASEIRVAIAPAVGLHRRVGEVRWTKERIVEASMRAFARQHPAQIAQEMGVSYSSVESILCRADMPREYTKGAFVDHYNRALGEANLKASGYKLDICRNTGWYYWRHEKDVGSRLCRVGRRRETTQSRGSLPGCREATV